MGETSNASAQVEKEGRKGGPRRQPKVLDVTKAPVQAPEFSLR
ncbi:hypothetical protein D8I24_3469 (plasmid) [Cupriavidus necator H850]|nr:hypothetical protein D8I24_3469 [Cupriavidus necator H850]